MTTPSPTTILQLVFTPKHKPESARTILWGYTVGDVPLEIVFPKRLERPHFARRATSGGFGNQWEEPQRAILRGERRVNGVASWDRAARGAAQSNGLHHRQDEPNEHHVRNNHR